MLTIIYNKSHIFKKHQAILKRIMRDLISHLYKHIFFFYVILSTIL